MRARESICEDIDGRTGSIVYDVGRALPGVFKIPKLQNQDPYLQYRFGVAIAGASDAIQIGTLKSEEMPEVDKRSPVTGFKGYPR
jgi:hypothetical protein